MQEFERRSAGASFDFAAVTGKMPPHSQEAEMGVLGGLLLENSSFDQIVDLELKPEDFYSESHRHVFKAIRDLLDKGQPADIITVSHSLQNLGLLERAGGRQYIADLADFDYSTSNIAHYAQIVRDKSQQRQIIRVCQEQSQKAYIGVEDHAGYTEETEKKLLEATASDRRSNFDSLKSVLVRNFTQLQEQAMRDGQLTGVPSGFKDLDKETSGFHGGQLIIVAARPGMGKTSLMLNLALHAAENSNGVAVFSLEMAREELSMRLLAMESRVDSSRLKNARRLQDEDWKKLTRAAGKLSEMPVYIDDTAALNLLEIKSRCRRLQTQHGLGLVIVDYLQLMRGLSSRGAGSSSERQLEIAEISRGLKALAKELNVPVIAASQLNRGVENRQDKRPMLSDLRESGAIEQDADMVLFIHREEMYQKDSHDHKGEAELIIGKHRSGSVGTVKLTWIGQYTTFRDWSGVEVPDTGVSPF
ncbi:MAG: replicative DNA helicase [Bdellovibrionales bacterium]|nr:replicative DNA helicase [Bdellovibrionales bacterium]